MSDMDHRRGREENERRIADQMRRINSGVGSGQLSEKQITDIARERANKAAERAVRDEPK
jgi:hypothetical protein